jgi:hypothetical protein
LSETVIRLSLRLLLSLLRLRDPRSGYGGALSVYFGLSAGLQQLHVSHISLGLRNNVFESCVVSVSVSGGNAYGGAVSIYMGAYSSRLNFSGDAAAAVGDTVVRNVSVALDIAQFVSCSARREINGLGNGSNVYGGSFSFYIGAYAWSRSDASSSSSTCGATDVIGVDVRVRHATSVDSTAFTHVSLLPTSSIAQSLGANSFGGAMSVLHVGAYSWSASSSASSSSACDATSVSGVLVQVSDSGCSNCSAVSSLSGTSSGANSYGGAMSALFVGAFSWSASRSASSSSACDATSVSGVLVQVSDFGCSNCSAKSSILGFSLGANSYGGAMSVLYVGAYSYSFSQGASKISCAASVTTTHVQLLSITINRSSFQNSMALSGGCYSPTLNAKDLTRFEISETGFELENGVSYGANVSSSAVILPFFACDAASWRRVTLSRFTAAQSAPWLGLLCGPLWELEAPLHHAAPSSATSAVFLSMACQYKTASHCPTHMVLSLRHRCSLVC